MANKKKNPEAASTPEQQARAASSSRKKQRKTYVSKTVKIILEKGLDQAPLQADPSVGIPLSSVYTVDGRFLRRTGEMPLH